MSAPGNDADDDQVPAWARRTAGESRWAATAAVIGILLVQYLLPPEYSAGPNWVVPIVGFALLIILVIANPVRLDREDDRLRQFSLMLMAVLGFGMVWSVAHLVMSLINGTSANNAAGLLGSGAAVWLSNVLVFALWYWDFDRGGPAARAHARQRYPDFLWVQMQNPALAEPDWEPQFPDYLYLSFTNATAFSPTDVMPMTRWAKLLMMVQSGISLVTVTLVVARAVNVLH
ncbi:DUF1345 domain-containing protein [Nocardia tengchongensis]|uniref:DUF1345 domain-containing protein n=1 Tax=Nocardia tengchongensis TaxID=2055889 RepID=A0ABX8CIV6_9NOCA|nr:DUF1345 domain-containing protein [Nocardia tengchongensis]QVI19873.1 DUF1345 domain-containing protein [Nocardia tengchongensis]